MLINLMIPPYYEKTFLYIRITSIDQQHQLNLCVIFHDEQFHICFPGTDTYFNSFSLTDLDNVLNELIDTISDTEYFEKFDVSIYSSKKNDSYPELYNNSIEFEKTDKVIFDDDLKAKFKKMFYTIKIINTLPN